MRLPDNHKRLLAVAVLTACGGLAVPALAAPPQAAPVNGPSADYPVVLGDSYSIGATTFTPSDTMNFDAVGYGTVAKDGAATVSAAHHTLPVPSYVEVTSLESGRTILVRVERRGPMAATNLIELSGPAAAQLGVGDHAALRVRRVNPPESDRALLRSGGQAPERMATPKPLLAVLARKLEQNDTVLLARNAASAPAATPAPAAQPAPKPLPKTGGAASFGAEFADLDPAPAAQAAAPMPEARPAAKPEAKPAPKLAVARPVHKPAAAAAAKPADIVAEAPAPATTAAVRSGMLVIQAGAFAMKGNAEQVAGKLGATVQGAGKLWRVRMGPYSSRVQAEAALAKAHAAGYSQARIQHAE